MNKLVIAVVLAGLSGATFAQGTVYDPIPPKDRFDATDRAEASSQKPLSIAANLIPRKDRVDATSTGATGSQTQIGGSSESSIWDYGPRRDRLDVQ